MFHQHLNKKESLHLEISLSPALKLLYGQFHSFCTATAQVCLFDGLEVKEFQKNDDTFYKET